MWVGVHISEPELTSSVVHKMTVSQDPSTSAKDSYYKCVNDSAVRDFDVTPELVYERLLSSTYVRFSACQWGILLN